MLLGKKTCFGAWIYSGFLPSFTQQVLTEHRPLQVQGGCHCEAGNKDLPLRASDNGAEKKNVRDRKEGKLGGLPSLLRGTHNQKDTV